MKITYFQEVCNENYVNGSQERHLQCSGEIKKILPLTLDLLEI